MFSRASSGYNNGSRRKLLLDLLLLSIGTCIVIALVFTVIWWYIIPSDEFHSASVKGVGDVSTRVPFIKESLLVKGRESRLASIDAKLSCEPERESIAPITDGIVIKSSISLLNGRKGIANRTMEWKVHLFPNMKDLSVTVLTILNKSDKCLGTGCNVIVTCGLERVAKQQVEDIRLKWKMTATALYIKKLLPSFSSNGWVSVQRQR
jgi:hypothetical protein